MVRFIIVKLFEPKARSVN